MDQRFRNSRPREQVSSSWFVVWIISRSLIERLAERYGTRLLFAPRPISRIEFDKISFFAESYRKNIWVRSRVPTRKSASFDPNGVANHHERDLRYDRSTVVNFRFLCPSLWASVIIVFVLRWAIVGVRQWTVLSEKAEAIVPKRSSSHSSSTLPSGEEK